MKITKTHAIGFGLLALGAASLILLNVYKKAEVPKIVEDKAPATTAQQQTPTADNLVATSAPQKVKVAKKIPENAPDEIKGILDKDLPDSEIREDLEEKGYNMAVIEELLRLKKEMKAAKITPSEIREATMGGKESREKFARSLPQNVQAQLIRTMKAWIAPSEDSFMSSTNKIQ